MPSGNNWFGMAYLTNPRQVGKSKTWFFTASMFLRAEGEGEEKITHGISGCLRYFDEGLLILFLSVGQNNSEYDLGPGLSDADKKDYAFVGDIIWLIPLHEIVYPEVDADSIASTPDNDKPLEPEVRIPKINTEHPPYIVFSGLPFNGNKEKGTFDIDIGQYTQLSKGGPLTVLPASCSIIDSPRWHNKKPVPYPGKFVSASGHVVAMENKQVNGSPHKKRFKIMVDNVVYLGNNNEPSTPATSSSSKRKIPPTFDGTPSWVKRHNNGGAPSSSPSGY
ncbi:hypothetical protein B0H13DRAFT_2375414 [Mycena leptocephala]|nr:hypothetical protein B0H13DRAFT_2375414 [Mycena leptocephala]